MKSMRRNLNGSYAWIHPQNCSKRLSSWGMVVWVPRSMEVLKRNGFDGVLIPDHTPQMACAAPWHAGMAYAMGYLRAALQMIE